MPGPVFIRGESVTLHPVEREDLPFLQRHQNDPAVRHGLTMNTPRNAAQAEEEFEQHLEDDSGTGFLVCVPDEEAEDGYRPVGDIVMFRIQQPAARAELACWIAPEEHGNGYATEATRLLLQYAFEERRMHRIFARAIASNTASRTVLEEKVGMIEEGVQRDEKYVDGQYEDVYVYRLLEDEWRAMQDDE